ncbi:MAG: hypothetical protein H9W81_12310 [Enterococcus sp.]|nr:hypothetical protein [Enterococcus sp.]
MSNKLFPERQRCANCRKKLEATVLDGMYCSYACLHIRVPSTKVDDAPRHCKRQINNAWGFKTRYRAESEVPQKLRDDPATNIYRCDYCHFLHVGHNRPVEFERGKLRRTITDPTTLGSVIARAREDRNIPISVLAKRLKVPAVRIKEIEAGDKNMRVDIMLAVLYTLRIQVVLQEK